MNKKVLGSLVGLLLLVALPARAEVEARYVQKLAAAQEVFAEAMRAPGRSIPPELLSRCKAVAIFPGTVKAGFIFGIRAGDGVVLTRDENGNWSAPAFFSMAGGSYGLQAGIQSMDVVLLIMNQRGLEALLKQKLTLGGDVAVTAGPASVSGEADVDVALRAEILAYTRARGLFAGISVNGARIASSRNMNRSFYGRDYSVDDILIHRTVPVPDEAARLIQTLSAYAAGSR